MIQFKGKLWVKDSKDNLVFIWNFDNKNPDFEFLTSNLKHKLHKEIWVYVLSKIAERLNDLINATWKERKEKEWLGDFKNSGLI